MYKISFLAKYIPSTYIMLYICIYRRPDLLPHTVCEHMFLHITNMNEKGNGNILEKFNTEYTNNESNLSN